MGREFFEQPATCSHSSIMVKVDRVGFEPTTSAQIDWLLLSTFKMAAAVEK